MNFHMYVYETVLFDDKDEAIKNNVKWHKTIKEIVSIVMQRPDNKFNFNSIGALANFMMDPVSTWEYLMQVQTYREAILIILKYGYDLNYNYGPWRRGLSSVKTGWFATYAEEYLSKIEEEFKIG